MRRVVFLAGLICFVMGVAAQVPFAQEAATKEKPKGAAAVKEADQPKPEDILRKMADYLVKQDALSLLMNLQMHIQANGMNNEMTTKTVIRVDRPDRYAMIVEDGVMGMTTINDGKQITNYMPSIRRYTVTEVAEGSEVTMQAGLMSGFGNLSDFVKAKSGEELLKNLMEGVKESKYLGSEDVDGVACDHLQFLQDEFGWEIWIEQGDKPLPRKIVPDMTKQLEAQLGDRAKDMKFEFNVTLTNWDTAPKFADEDFAFIPPAGAEKVDSMFEGLGGGGREEGPHPLLGQEAPKFETVNPSGEPVDLAKYLGKNVIMLDFWATWCGPCVAAMPEVDGVAKKFADKGVVFYAVNLGDDVETVKQFLTDKGFEVPVAMDADGKIGGLYMAEAIPQTVLIGKDGKVQAVHVGFSQNLAEELTKELTDLVAGKDLASEVLAKAEKKSDKGGDEAAGKATDESKQ